MSGSTISLIIFIKHIKGHVRAPCLSLNAFALYIEYLSYDHILLSIHVSYFRINYHWIVLSFDALIDLYL